MFTVSKFALFSLSGLEDEMLMKKQTYVKTDTYKLYSRDFEYFCQISSKLILIILSYTISKLARFLRHDVSVGKAVPKPLQSGNL